MAINAAAMAESKERPQVTLPRLRWVPWIGPLLSRILPPKTYTGIVLSNDEFRPLREEWEQAWNKATEGEMTEEDARPVIVRFLKAQRLPVRSILSLPGSVLEDVLAELFICQTRANLPRQVAEKLEEEFKKRIGPVSPGRARRSPRRRQRATQS